MLEDLHAYMQGKKVEEENTREDNMHARLLKDLVRSDVRRVSGSVLPECSNGDNDALVERMFDDRFRTSVCSSRQRVGRLLLGAIDAASGLALAWNLLVDPFRIAFLETEDPFRLPLGGPIFSVTFVTDMLAVVEIFSKLVLEDDMCLTGGYLLSRGMWFDVVALAALPTEMGTTIRFGSEHVTLWSLVGLLRLFRCHKLGRMICKLAVMDSISAVSLFTCQMILLVVSAAHLSACGFFFIAKYERFGDDSWIARFDPDLIDDVGLDGRYITTLYWAMTTLSTTGYGDIAASSLAEKSWTILVMVFGYVLQAMVVGNLTTLFLRRSNDLILSRIHMDRLNQFMHDYKIPHGCRETVRDELRANIMKGGNIVASPRDDGNDLDLLRSCTSTVKNRLLLTVFHPILANSYLLQGLDVGVMKMILGIADMRSFAAGVTLVRCGHASVQTDQLGFSWSTDVYNTDNSSLFILVEGSVEYAMPEYYSAHDHQSCIGGPEDISGAGSNSGSGGGEKLIVRVGRTSDVFGEHALFHGRLRSPWSVSTVSPSKMLVLDANAIEQMLHTIDSASLCTVFENVRDYYTEMSLLSTEYGEHGRVAESAYGSVLEEAAHSVDNVIKRLVEEKL